MPTASVTNSFVNGQAADADDVNQNFSDLVSFLNTHVVQRDGSQDMGGDLDLGSNKIVNVADPTADQDAATKAYVDDVRVPIGGMVDWAVDPIPDGWMTCDGSAISRTTYATLFALIGTTFGEGDGSTTFNLPDVGAKFINYTGATGSVGDEGGSGTHVHTGGLHTHVVQAHGHGNTFAVGSETSGDGDGPGPGTAGVGHYHAFTGDVSDKSSENTLSGGEVDTSSVDHRPPYIRLQKIIRVS